MSTERDSQIVPVISIREAIRWKTTLSEEIAKLVREYEKRVPHVRVESIQITRAEKKTRIGMMHSSVGVTARVTLMDEFI